MTREAREGGAAHLARAWTSLGERSDDRTVVVVMFGRRLDGVLDL
jgi:hypothetical protein